jgi:carboxypeptidase PM20D1
MRKTGLAALAMVVALLGVIVGRTFTLESRQMTVDQVPAIAVDRHGAAGRLAEAVRFRTVSLGPDEPVADEALEGLRAYMTRVFPRVHRTVTRELVGGHSLLYTWQGSDPELAPILLMAHMDVVPVEPETEGAWTQPPFAGAVGDGFVWGRGTLDDKQTVMALLEAAEHLIGDGFRPRRTVYFAFGHDEEIGGGDGAAKIAEMLERRGVRLGFVLDEGSMVLDGLVARLEPPAALIGLSEKGYLSVELTVEAKGGHSSMPPKSTAVGRLARAVHRLEANPLPAAIGGPVAAMFDYLSPEVGFAFRILLANRWLLDPLLIARMEADPSTNALLRTTTAPTIFNAGVKDNVLPGTARAVVNFRILPGETVETVLEHMRATIDDPAVGVGTLFAFDPSPMAATTSPAFEALHKSIRQVMPDVVVAPSLVVGATDSRHFQAIADDIYRFVPLRLEPEDLERIHGLDERIAVDNYVEIIRFYVQLIRNAAA